MNNGENKQVNINITVSSIIRIIIVLVVIALLYILRDILLILIVSIILASAVNPWVSAMQKKRIPRVFGALIIFAITLGLFSLIIALLVPPIATQISDISHNFSRLWSKLITDFSQFQSSSIQKSLLDNLQKGLQSLQANIGQATAGVFNALASIFGGFFSFIGIVVITFYILIEENAMSRFLRSVLPAKYQPYIFQTIKKMQERLGQWLKGQLILGFIVGLLVFIGLSIFNVKYALVLGLWAGLTEMIPYLGPFLGGIPGVFIALTTGGPTKAIIVAAIYIVIQQLENNLLVPKVMQKTTGLNPLVVIIAVLVGAKIAGILGILLAVPVVLVIKTFTEDFWARKKEEQEKVESI